MTRNQSLTLIAVGGIALAALCAHLIADVLAQPPLPEGVKQPEREVTGPKLVKPDQHDALRFPFQERFEESA